MSDVASNGLQVVDRQVVPSAGWGRGCCAWALVDAPGLSVRSEHLPAGAGEQRHVHDRARQFFFVLAGGACIEVEGRRFQPDAGQGLEVPPGRVHTVHATGASALELLLISAPSSRGDRRAA